jgi:hypothetical protein
MWGRARKMLKPVAIGLLTIATLGCGASNVNATYGKASSTTTTSGTVRVCRGDPPTLPCQHVDLGR